MKSIDLLQLQRLIDGESSISEIQQLLKLAGQDSGHWQTIALALMEERALQRKWLETESGGPGSTDAQTGVSSQPIKSLVGTTEAETSEKKWTESSPANRTEPNLLNNQTVGGGSVDPKWDSGHRAVVRKWLAVAAAIALATLIGYRWGQRQPLETLAGIDRGGFELKSSGTEDDLAANTASRITPVQHRPDYHLELSDVAGGQLRGTVPLYSLESFEQWKIDDLANNNLPFSLSSEQLHDLHQQGIRVHEKLEFISGDLENGKKFLVPVRSIRFSPGY
jgi:hypothetical protein